MTWIRTLLATLSLAILTACSSLGMLEPQSPAERIAATVVSVTAIRQSTQTLLVAKKITPDDAEHVQRQADQVVAGAQIARSMLGVDPAAADAKLQQTRAVLLALQSYLAAREGAKR
jgi:hypothetical protein